MYSSGPIVSSPSCTIGTSSPAFASASSRLGASSWSPLRKTTSACSIRAASLGAGSKVWLFAPSGTMPVIETAGPPTFCTMFVIGETVVTTWSRPSSPAGAAVPHAVTRRTGATHHAARRTCGCVDGRRRMVDRLPASCKMLQQRAPAATAAETISTEASRGSRRRPIAGCARSRPRCTGPWRIRSTDR